MARKKAAKKANVVPQGFSKGLLIEFVIFVFLQGFDIYCDYAVYFEAKDASVTFEKISAMDPAITSSKNYSKPLTYCTSSFDTNKIEGIRAQYNDALGIYLVFLVFASLIFGFAFLLWVCTLVFSVMEADFLQDNWDLLVKGKVGFTLAANFVQDIPTSMLAMALYLLRRGSYGLLCWQCSMSIDCVKDEQLEVLMAPSTTNLALLIVAITISTLWKAISSFFRWSRFDECEFFLVRAATSLFAGFLYGVIILTPMMTLLKYQYFTLPGVTPGLLGSIVDKLFLVGALFWALLLMAICCCPCLRLIRLAQ